MTNHMDFIELKIQMKVDLMIEKLRKSDQYFDKNILLSPEYATHHFYQIIIKVINNVSLFKALVLLLNEHISITEIAFEVGYNDPKYFTKCFKRKLGLTPRVYRESIRAFVNEKESENKFIKQASYIVERNLSNDNFNIDHFAFDMNVSKATLYRKLKTHSGLSPIEFTQLIKLNKAERMMKIETYNISDIAYCVGFNDVKYFSRCFKTKFGFSPSTFRKSLVNI